MRMFNQLKSINMADAEPPEDTIQVQHQQSGEDQQQVHQVR